MKNEDFLNNSINFCVVEDDPAFRDTFASMLEKYGRVIQIGTYQEAIRFLKTNTPDILFIDMELNGVKDGPKIVDFAARKDIHCVVVSGLDDEETINDCINLGAKDYFVKGDELSLVKEIISKYKKTYKKPTQGEFLYTNHPAFKDSLIFLIDNAKKDYPVLLTGPTGSGKTFFAKQIHMRSEVSGKFVAVNCSSIPKELFESEMFGHKKGAFSGAVDNHDGKIAEAHNGTLYLDEIDSMPLEQQAKLLKVIEDKEFYAVGSNEIKKSNFRLICSAQKDLKKLINEGKFREDLYYRISLIETRILPLAERVCDIIPLLKMMLKGPRRYYFAADFKTFVEKQSWPGNLRELQIFASNIQLTNESRLTENLAASILRKKNQDLPFLTQHQLDLIEEIGINKFLEEVKKEAYKHFFKHNNESAQLTCQSLQVKTSTFYETWKRI